MTNDKKLSQETFPEQVENQAPTSNSWLDSKTPGASVNDDKKKPKTSWLDLPEPGITVE